MKEHKLILIVLAVALISRIVFFSDFHEIWWDSGVYIGMGKYLFSLGDIGLWEHIRPALWPAVLGLLWFVKLSPIIAGRALEIFLSLGIVWLSYIIARHYFDKKSALVSAVIIAFSSTFFFMGFHLYSEIPSVFFALLGVYLFAKDRHYLSGLSAGLAFASKFPSGIFIVCMGIALIFLKPSLRKYVYLGAGFLTVFVPYLALNHLAAGSMFQPFIEARTNRVILSAKAASLSFSSRTYSPSSSVATP